MKTKTMIQTAIFAAITTVVTFALPIPSPAGGYIHFGDSVIYLAALLMSGPSAAAAAAIGSGLADLIGGYTIYALPTAIIKGLMALCASSAFKLIRGTGGKILGFVFGSLIMVGGYYIVEVVMMRSFAAPLINVPYNLIQALISVPLPILIAPYLKKFFK